MARCKIIFTFYRSGVLGSALPALSESRMGVSSATGRIRRGEHVGCGVSPKQAFLGAMLRFGIGNRRKSLRRRDAVASTRDECATRNSNTSLARWTLLVRACAMKL